MTAADALHVPEPVKEIAARLEQAGYETWTVGGAVRDALLGGDRSDWDLATAAHPDIVRKLFRPAYPIGVRFGTVGVRGSDGRVYEVTTFRKDIETDGRHAVVEYAQTIEEDLARRDFTINAIAYHPLEPRFLDPHAGRADLQKRVLRCVGEARLRFAEDYLRVLRGLRFAGRYRLEIEPHTWSALRAAVPDIARLSGERVREELLKVLTGPNAAAALDLYRRSGALTVVFTEFEGMDDESWKQTRDTITSIAPQRTQLRITALLVPASGHLDDVMERLRFSNAELRLTRELIEGLRQPLPPPGDPVAARRWLRDVGPQRARDVLLLHGARARARGAEAGERADLARRARAVLGALRRHEPVTLADLAIDGNDLKQLGLDPGPDFARILEECLEAVIEDPARNERETLLRMVRERFLGTGSGDS